VVAPGRINLKIVYRKLPRYLFFMVSMNFTIEIIINNRLINRFVNFLEISILSCTPKTALETSGMSSHRKKTRGIHLPTHKFNKRKNSFHSWGHHQVIERDVGDRT
jgi:hypothetical protein